MQMNDLTRIVLGSAGTIAYRIDGAATDNTPTGVANIQTIDNDAVGGVTIDKIAARMSGEWPNVLMSAKANAHGNGFAGEATIAQFARGRGE